MSINEEVRILWEYIFWEYLGCAGLAGEIPHEDGVLRSGLIDTASPHNLPIHSLHGHMLQEGLP